MPRYYVNRNAKANGDHEVHVADCIYLPLPKNQYFLGVFDDCSAAVFAAKEVYTQVNGCKTCSSACHTT